VTTALYSVSVSSLTINDELFTSSGAQSMYQAAVDELGRRYGPGDEEWQIDPQEFTPPLGIFLVARLDAHPAGCVAVRSISEPALHLGEVKRLWVRPDLRRSGLAGELMSRIEGRSREAGYVRLYLETGEAQPEAQALYPKLNWTPVDEFPSGAYSYPNAFRFTKLL
jgi:GNAT superfamily N-acetyltransferase